MTSPNNLIRDALTERLAGIVDLPELVWTDKSLEPDSDTPYILATFLVHTRQAADQVLKIKRGMLQLDVRYPALRSEEAENIAASIEDVFPMTGEGIQLSDGQTWTESALAQNGTQEGTWWKVPVVISWINYA